MSPAAAALPGLDERQPWLGLTSYRETDSELFFGREKESLELQRLVHREVLTVLFGPSGTGKTSLLNAGLFPRLRESACLPIAIRLDHSGARPDYIGQIRALIAGALQAVPEHPIEEDPLAPPQAQPDAETVWEYFHRVALWDWRNNPVTPVLVFDQFEEIFTLARNKDATDEFLEALADLAENHIPASVRSRMEAGGGMLPFPHGKSKCKIILSLREDFVGRLDGVRKAMPSVMYNRFTISRMNGEQALLAVKEPGRDLVESQVALQIVHFVAGKYVARGATAAGDIPLDGLQVDPALLSVVCRELNNLRIERKQSRITEDLLDQAGSDILNDFYGRGFVGLNPAVRVFVEDRLLTGSGFRSTVPFEEATQDGIAPDDIETLVVRRLIRKEERLGIPHLELTHDLLTKVVQKSRAERQERERREVERQQREREERERAEQERHRKEQLQRARRWIIVVGSAAAVSLLFGLAAGFFFMQARGARKAAESAREQAVNLLINATWTIGQYVVTSAGMRSENSYVFGTRALYKWTTDKGLLDMATLKSLAPVPIFMKGPHSGGLNLTASEFGYYNPAFVRWATDHAIPASTDETLRSVSQPFYDVCLRTVAHDYYDAYQYLRTRPGNFIADTGREYLDKVQREPGTVGGFLNPPSLYLQERFRSFAEKRSDFYNSVVACGFWVRRHIDGTDTEFFSILEKLLSTYDAAWLQQRQTK